jgi:hypothetical protein
LNITPATARALAGFPFVREQTNAPCQSSVPSALLLVATLSLESSEESPFRILKERFEGAESLLLSPHYLCNESKA